MQKGKARIDHQHLLIKQIMTKLKGNTQYIRQRLRQKNIDYYGSDQETQRSILHEVIEEFKETEEGQNIMEELSRQLKQQVELVSNSKVKKQGYLIDCFREATAFPIAKERQSPAFNLKLIHGKYIKKELRRVVWSRMFNIDRFRIMFVKWDREVTPYKIKEELKVSLEKSCGRHNLNLKDNQLEVALRIVEYFLKAQGRLPQRYHFFISLLIVDLFSFTKIDKINQLGAATLGVMNLLEFYSQDTTSKANHLKKALEIVDPDTFSFIQNNFLTGTEASKRQKELLESFQMFKLTSGCYYLPLQIGQFIADQLIIRKRCKFDMYTLFSIMILIISDEFEQGFNKGKTLKQIIESSRQIIKKEQYIESYNVIFQNVPAWFTADDLAEHPNNKLLAQMLAFQRQEVENEGPSENQEGFVVDVDLPIRMGSKK